MNICIVCKKRIGFTLSFGFTKCFDKHRLCKNCAEEKFAKSIGYDCRLDNNATDLMIKWPNKCPIKILDIKLFFQTVDYIKSKNESCTGALGIVDNMYLTGKSPINICLTCLQDLENKTACGYKDCFNDHRQCVGCAERDLKCFNTCPRDNRKSDVVVKMLDKPIVSIKESLLFFQTIDFIKSNTKDPIKSRSVIDSMYADGNFPIKHCMSCLENIDNGTYCGFKDCFEKHKFCTKCFHKVSQGCPVNKGKGKMQNIQCHQVQAENGQRRLIEKSVPFFQTVFWINLVCKDENKSKTMIDNMYVTGTFPLKSCIVCFENIEDGVVRGYKHCIDQHRMCRDCTDKLSGEYKYCPVDYQRSELISE